MHVHSPIFLRPAHRIKIRSITFIVWVPGRFEKNAKKGKKYILVLNKYQV